MLESNTLKSNIPVLVQEYIPNVKDGDKRIFLLDGEPIGAVNRISRKDDFRCNMAAGRSVSKTAITDQYRKICRSISPILKEYGLYLVGIDVIGGQLTELNVTTPTGIREIDLLAECNLGEEIINWVVLNCRK